MKDVDARIKLVVWDPHDVHFGLNSSRPSLLEDWAWYTFCATIAQENQATRDPVYAKQSLSRCVSIGVDI
jgi:hypothetical protein